MGSRTPARRVEWEEEAPADGIIGAANVVDSRSEKKRRDMVMRIEKLREAHLSKRDEVYTQTWKELRDAEVSLAINPPTNVPYLLRLHRESLKRENELLAVRVYHNHLVECASRTYEAEVKSIEEEYNMARTQAKEKLAEAIDEHRRKLRDEKDLVDFSDEAVGSAQRTRATKALRNRGGFGGRSAAVFSRSSPAPGYGRSTGTPDLGARLSSLLGEGTSADIERGETIFGGYLAGAQGHGGPPGLLGAEDPLSMAALNVNPHMRDSPVFQQLLSLGTHSHGRGRGKKAMGLPSANTHLNIQPGVWLGNTLKSQNGISANKPEDTDADLTEIKRALGQATKKRRGVTLTSAMRKKMREEYG